MKKTRFVTVTIDSGNVIDADPVVRAEPGDLIVFSIVNNDPAVDYFVWIEPNEIIQRQDKGLAVPPPTNPLQTVKHYKKVTPGEIDHLKHKLRPRADFGRGGAQIPYTTYKYSIKSGLTANDPHPVILDPDIDVVTP
jgi:hypothetical protein